MNFKQWYKNWRGEDYYDGQPKSGELVIGWNACKQEVLKILNKHKQNEFGNGFEGENSVFFDYIHEDAIKEIEKL